jgi:hypothetical protein
VVIVVSEEVVDLTRTSLQPMWRVAVKSGHGKSTNSENIGFRSRRQPFPKSARSPCKSPACGQFDSKFIVGNLHWAGF